MLVRLDIAESQKFNINMSALKELFQKYGYRGGKRIRPSWVEQLMHEIDPYKYYLEWEVPELSLEFASDIKKLLNACPNLPQMTIVFSNGAKFIIRKDEKAVRIYERMKEEL